MKDRVRKLTAAERKKLSALIEQIDRKDEAAWRKELLRRHREIKAGNGVSREELMHRYGIREEELR